MLVVTDVINVMAACLNYVLFHILDVSSVTQTKCIIYICYVSVPYCYMFRCQFCPKMVLDTPKRVGEVWHRYLVNIECVFGWCNWRDIYVLFSFSILQQNVTYYPHVTCIWGEGGCYRVLVGKPAGKKSLRKPRL